MHQEPSSGGQRSLKAVIIDDEPDCVKLLALQLKMYCPQVEVVAECTESDAGLLKIKSLQPDIVFLDIEMPVMNGFQLLEKIDNINFSLVFLTSLHHFRYIRLPLPPADNTFLTVVQAVLHSQAHHL